MSHFAKQCLDTLTHAVATNSSRRPTLDTKKQAVASPRHLTSTVRSQRQSCNPLIAVAGEGGRGAGGELLTLLRLMIADTGPLGRPGSNLKQKTTTTTKNRQQQRGVFGGGGGGETV